MRIWQAFGFGTLVALALASCGDDEKNQPPDGTGGTAGGTVGMGGSLGSGGSSINPGGSANVGGNGGVGGSLSSTGGGGGTLSTGGSGGVGGTGGSGGTPNATGGTGGISLGGAAGDAGGGGEGGGIIGPPEECIDVEPAPVDPNCESIGAAVASLYQRCSTDYMEFAWGTEAETAAVYRQECEKRQGLPGIELTMDDWVEWAGKLKAMPCQCYVFYEDPWEFYYGTLEDGEPCLVGSQCASSWCDGAGYTSCGTCRATKVEGEACVVGDCGSRMRCNAGSNTCEQPREYGEECVAHHDCAGWLPCYGGKCGDPLDVGEACAGQSFNECDVTKGICGAGTCQPRNTPGLGQNCLFGIYCQGNTYCEQTEASADYWLCESRGDVGDPCTIPANEPLHGTCLPHLLCDEEGTGTCYEPTFPTCEVAE